VADRLDIVAIGIAHKGAVVVGVVLGPQARLVKHVHTHLGSGGEELTNGCTTRRDKSDVALPKAFAGLTWPNPELRLAIDTEADDLAELHDAAPSERGEDGVVELGARRGVGTLKRKVIEHEYIFAEVAVAQ
jgi:hypothetical protein